MSTPPTPDLPAEAAAAVWPDRLAWLRVGLKNRMVLGHTPDVAEFLAEYDTAVRTAALTEAADAAAVWTGDETPEEDRPGYDGATIDPEDRLRDAIDPEVGPGRREQLITEYRDMVVGEIAGELRRLAAATTTTPTPEEH